MKVQPTIIIQNCILSFKYNLIIIGFKAGLHFVLDTLKVRFYCLLNCSLSCRAPKPKTVKFLNKALTINIFKKLSPIPKSPIKISISIRNSNDGHFIEKWQLKILKTYS